MRKTEFIYEAKLIRVVDGDTFVLQVDLGLDVYTISKFRLLGVDTPEVYGVKKGSDEWVRGKAASTFVQEWFDAHKGDVIIHTHKATGDLAKGKYGRWLVEVHANDNTQDPSIGETLIAEKLVK